MLTCEKIILGCSMWILIPILLILLDAVYIGSQLQALQYVYFNIQKSPLKVRYTSAALCYVFLTALLYFFILKPNRPIRDAFLLGVCVYGVYDTTTYALLRNYPLRIAVMDVLWGGTLFALTTYIYRLVFQK
jgi:uncharacterized membrane protein